MQRATLSSLVGLVLLCLVRADEGVCGPFELTSTHGELYFTEDGIQFPGPAFNSLNDSIYNFFPSNGSLHNLAGDACTFDPYFRCAKDVPASEDMDFSLAYEYDELRFRANSTFFVCPPAAVKNTALSLRTSTMTFSQNTMPFGTIETQTIAPTGTLELQYIFGVDALPYLDVGTDGSDESHCWAIGIAGSGCSSSTLITSGGKTTIRYVSSTDDPTATAAAAVSSSLPATASANPTSANPTSSVATPTSGQAGQRTSFDSAEKLLVYEL